MKPVFTVAPHGSESPAVPPPPPPPAGLHMVDDGEGRRRWHIGGGVGARPVVGLLLFLAVTVAFAFAVRRARRSHSGRDLAFAIVTYYLVLVFACCVAKLRQLQRDPAAAAATAAERRRVRIGTWVVSAALGTVATLRIVEAVPGLALKLLVAVVSLVLHGIGFYFFLRKGAGGGDAEELGGGGRPPKAFRGELSPEEKV